MNINLDGSIYHLYTGNMAKQTVVKTEHQDEGIR